MGNTLDPEYAFAFAINPDGQLPKLYSENRQVIVRSLDRYLEARALTVFLRPVRTILATKNGLDCLYIERGPGSLNNALEYLGHDVSGLEEEISAVLCLVNRVGVLETGSLLFGQIQSKAQTR